MDNKNQKCEMCKGELILKDTRIIGGAKYSILECKKCKHKIARTVSEH